MKRTLAAALSRPGSLDDLHFDLDVFDGPFDLLVTLILKEEVDVWEVRVSRIVADYALRFAESDAFDVEAASHFIVMVAALLEMKSRRLLAECALVDSDEASVDFEESGEELVVALARYSQFKGAADDLRRRYREHAGRRYRGLPFPERFLRVAGDHGGLPPGDLAAALTILLAEPPAPDVGHITDLTVSVVEELRRLRLLLDRDGEFTFSAIAPHDRLEKAITFFALLELHNRGEARLHQRAAFAEIVVRRLDERVAFARDDALTAVG
jgi:segregation and condensation protein A